MPSFVVAKVLDGNCFEVANPWSWEKQVGRRVLIHGCRAPELTEPGGAEAKKKLSALLVESRVELTTAYGIQGECLICDVYLRGRNIAELFPEYCDHPKLA